MLACVCSVSFGYYVIRVCCYCLRIGVISHSDSVRFVFRLMEQIFCSEKYTPHKGVDWCCWRNGTFVRCKYGFLKRKVYKITTFSPQHSPVSTRAVWWVRCTFDAIERRDGDKKSGRIISVALILQPMCTACPTLILFSSIYAVQVRFKRIRHLPTNPIHLYFVNFFDSQMREREICSIINRLIHTAELQACRTAKL